MYIHFFETRKMESCEYRLFYNAFHKEIIIRVVLKNEYNQESANCLNNPISMHNLINIDIKTLINSFDNLDEETKYNLWKRQLLSIKGH